MKLEFTLSYIALIAAANWVFAALPAFRIDQSLAIDFAAVLVGVVFVARDYAQKEVGHWVLAAMAIGAGLSYLMAPPLVALASGLAFLASEIVDWAVYSAYGRRMSDRVLISSLAATPVDSFVFLELAGDPNWRNVLARTALKLIAAFLVFAILRRTESRRLFGPRN